MKLDVVFYAPLAGSLFAEHGRDAAAGGAERQIAMITRGLAADGWRVGVMIKDPRGELSSRVDGVEVIRVEVGRVGPRTPLVGKLAVLLQITWALRHIRVATIVKRGSGSDVGLFWIAAKLKRARFVFSSANLADFSPDQAFATNLLRPGRDLALYKAGVRHATVVVAQTREQSLLCREMMGRDAEVIRSMARVNEGTAGNASWFLWVGRLAPEKNAGAYLRLAARLPGAKFRMVVVPRGDADPIEAELREAAAALPNLELFGPQSPAALLSLMEQAIAIISTSDNEGMPNVLLEAWTLGVPGLVLTHDPDGLVQRFGLGDFAHGDEDSLASFARHYWQRRSVRDMAVADRCRDYIATHHDPAVVLRAWESVLLSAPDPRAA